MGQQLIHHNATYKMALTILLIVLVFSDEKLAEEYGTIDFIAKSIPFFIGAVLLELLLSPLHGKRIRLNDSLTSITGRLSKTSSLFLLFIQDTFKIETSIM